jgi:ABC-type glycerol-3-phosphate transport system substrate-binding protein
MLGSAVLVALAAPLVAACGSQAAPTAAPAGKPAEPAKPATPAAAPAAATKPAAAPAQAATPAAAPQAASGAKIPLSLATRSGITGDWARTIAKRWQERHPEVDLTIHEVPYGDMAKKQLLQIAAGDMEDVSFSGVKWYPYSVYKGAFRPIDDYLKTNDPGLDDFLKPTLGNALFEGKMYGLPDKMDNGNLALAIFNVDHLTAKGLKVPTDEWTIQEFTELAIKAHDKDRGVFGTNYLPTTFYDYASLARTWGTDIFTPDSKTLLFNTDPKSVEAARWLTDLRAKHKIAPKRDESQQGVDFPAGKIAITFDSISGVQATTKTVGNKFTWDVLLFPKGPTGLRGYHTFTQNLSIYVKSKQPEKAYDLITLLTSKEAGVYAVVEGNYSPNCRKSVWADPQVQKTEKSFPRVFQWISSVEGTFPIPDNLRFSELQDKWENISLPLWYGETPFEDGMKKIQEQCQAIMDKPR